MRSPRSELASAQSMPLQGLLQWQVVQRPSQAREVFKVPAPWLVPWLRVFPQLEKEKF